MPANTLNDGKDQIAKLCQYFTTNRQAFLVPGVKEAHVRQSLIDPFFEALGWDVGNSAMTAPQYREVIPEDSVDVEGQQKAPDYTFRVGSQPKFYAEAKKCGMNVGTAPAPAFQLRRYGWSAKLAVSILTDFEELGVYDCTVRPRPSEKASYARIQYFHFQEYPDRWSELWDVFSREAVWSGRFDQYALSKRKRGTSEVDVEFLKEMEGWRLALASNIALRNKKLSLDDLNAAVQLTIDRVVFLRMAEDRGLEPYEQLLKLCERPDIYSRFMHNLSRRADEKYNSGLFHFQKESSVSEEPDRITPNLAVDDKVFKLILQSLYFAYGSPYQFGVMPVEILGTVYERFLGKVIRLTSRHQAKIEEKPEVRKAGGVYYTPAYIVDYIVKQTVARQIERQSPAQLAGSKDTSPFRVLDMACGSGSFLLGAYRCLLNHYLDWYARHKPENFNKAVYKDSRDGHWRLTIEEKKRILTTHLFGVDIDHQAVEVTKLSLLLKVLEGETDQSFSLSQLAFGDRALPNLADNIKCGNSLIAPDYFTGKLFSDPEEMKRVNTFDWDRGFPDAMKGGGFDCVIGNPPYVFGRDWKALNIGSDQKTYFNAKYSASPYQLDMFSLFMEKAVHLVKLGGRVGQIVPNVWLTNTYSSTTRSFVLSQARDLYIAVCPRDVFAGITVDTVVYTLEKSHKSGGSFGVKSIKEDALRDIATYVTAKYLDGQRPISTAITPGSADLAERIREQNVQLSSVAAITRGVHPYRLGGYGKSAFGSGAQTRRDLAERPYHSSKKKRDYRPFVYGRDLHRFTPPHATEYVKYGPWLAEPRGPEFFEGERVYSRKILADRLVVTVETIDSVADQQVYITKPTQNFLSAAFLAGILGSRLMACFIRSYYDEATQAFPQIKVSQLKALPIPKLDLSSGPDSGRRDEIVRMVNSMLVLYEQLSAAKSVQQKIIVQRQIDATDRQIDQLVYQLYRLTDEEIAQIENPTLASSSAP
jgi:type I restriction-modification system DNA methylase subunit